MVIITEYEKNSQIALHSNSLRDYKVFVQMHAFKTVHNIRESAMKRWKVIKKNVFYQNGIERKKDREMKTHKSVYVQTNKNTCQSRHLIRNI